MKALNFKAFEDFEKYRKLLTSIVKSVVENVESFFAITLFGAIFAKFLHFLQEVNFFEFSTDGRFLMP